eukprot:3024909-Amphidinium_carterae.1
MRYSIHLLPANVACSIYTALPQATLQFGAHSNSTSPPPCMLHNCKNHFIVQQNHPQQLPIQAGPITTPYATPRHHCQINLAPPVSPKDNEALQRTCAIFLR